MPSRQCQFLYLGTACKERLIPTFRPALMRWCSDYALLLLVNYTFVVNGRSQSLEDIGNSVTIHDNAVVCLVRIHFT